MSNAAARRKYANDGTGVLSNQQILVKLFERLDRDLMEAASHCALGDRPATHAATVHAEEILYELIGALDTDAWDGAAQLQNLYVFCVNEIINATLAMDAVKFNECRELLAPIGEAWRDALTSADSAEDATRAV